MTKRLDLNKVAYAVRATQAVQQYGVGAMVDFPDQTLVTANPEEWENPKTIYDERFAKSLGVKWFATPTTIAYSRFPEWYFCPKCRKFQTLDDWIAEYRMKNPNNSDVNMINRLRCPTCWQDLVASRIVTVCESGHLNDFPWVQWVHAKSHKKICGEHPVLQFKTGTSSSEGLEGLIVKCCSCGASTSLKGAFDKNCFEKLDEEFGTGTFFCKGKHPFKGKTEPCQHYPKTMQRGGSSVYFPLTYSSIVIPPYSDKLRVKIEQSDYYDFCEKSLDDEENEEDKQRLIESRLDKWSAKISDEIGATPESVKKILLDKWVTNKDRQPTEITSVKYRMEEYDALTGKAVSFNDDLGDFVRTEMDASEYKIPHLKSVALIEKVRVVTAFVGFSRINPITKMTDPGFVEIKKSSTPWYPANEVRGEGIFIELNQNDIDEWLRQDSTIASRADILTKHYSDSFIGSTNPRVITPKYLMLHTLSHLLIKQLSFECGYNIASLCERIYCSEKSDGQEMAGIFIYTSSGDSEGTLGGLVRQGRPDTLPKIIRKAVNGARICSNDPVCMLSHGQGRESLNLAACHACMLLPETCCEERNSLLDRATIIGTYEKPEIGFWADLRMQNIDIKNNTKNVQNKNSWVESRRNIGQGLDTKQPTISIKEYKNVSYGHGENLKNDYKSWRELSSVINSFDVDEFGKRDIQLPDEYGGSFSLDGYKIDSFVAWIDKKIAITDDVNVDEEAAIEKIGWKIYKNSQIDIEQLIKNLRGE